jgi:hypothetical protein
MINESQLRTEFAKLRSQDLLAVARNQAAHARMLAIAMLVERAAKEAMHPDIAAESQNFVLSNPLILKKVNPTDLMGAKIPGIVDVVDADIKARQSLERTVSKNHETQSDRTASLESIVSTNNETQTKALSEQAESHSKEIATQDKRQSGALSAAVASLEKKLSDMKAEADKELNTAKDRLALLERSLWRKFVDSLKAIVKRLRSGRTE